jgi:hypothetical protein
MAPSDDISVASSEDWSNSHEDMTNVVTTSRSKGAPSESVWVQKTYGMVTEGSRRYPNVITWSADGEEFAIKDVEALKQTLFPKYHGRTKFESFLRRLRRYGFQRVKTETITKPTDGKPAAVVLSFRHDCFKQDRPDLLGNVSIISQQNETTNSAEEKQTFESAIARLEQSQQEMRASMNEIREQSLEQKSRIDHLRQEAIQKDEVMRRLEARVERLETSVLMASGPSGPAPQRTYSLWSAFAQLPAQKSTKRELETSLTFMAPTQPISEPSLVLKERDISAIDFLPAERNDSNLYYDEPTLPRSKKMKFSQKNESLEAIALSRQSTPVFWRSLIFN